LSEMPSDEERLQHMERFRQWRRSNSIGCVAWLMLVVLIDAVLRNWLPESMQLLLVAGILAIPPAWWVRKAYIERRAKKDSEQR
jgi:Flp pilus assembly protein TadB